MNSLFRYCGTPVTRSYHLPTTLKIELRRFSWMDEGFIDEFDKWSEAMFGNNGSEDMNYIMNPSTISLLGDKGLPGKMLVMNRVAYRKLKHSQPTGQQR